MLLDEVSAVRDESAHRCVLWLERAELRVVRLHETPGTLAGPALPDPPVLRDLPGLDEVDPRGVPGAGDARAQALVDGACRPRRRAPAGRERPCQCCPGPGVDVDARQVLEPLLGLAAESAGSPRPARSTSCASRRSGDARRPRAGWPPAPPRRRARPARSCACARARCTSGRRRRIRRPGTGSRFSPSDARSQGATPTPPVRRVAAGASRRSRRPGPKAQLPRAQRRFFRLPRWSSLT